MERIKENMEKTKKNMLVRQICELSIGQRAKLTNLHHFYKLYNEGRNVMNQSGLAAK